MKPTAQSTYHPPTANWAQKILEILVPTCFRAVLSAALRLSVAQGVTITYESERFDIAPGPLWGLDAATRPAGSPVRIATKNFRVYSVPIFQTPPPHKNPRNVQCIQLHPVRHCPKMQHKSGVEILISLLINSIPKLLGFVCGSLACHYQRAKTAFPRVLRWTTRRGTCGPFGQRENP